MADALCLSPQHEPQTIPEVEEFLRPGAVLRSRGGGTTRSVLRSSAGAARDSQPRWAGIEDVERTTEKDARDGLLRGNDLPGDCREDRRDAGEREAPLLPRPHPLALFRIGKPWNCKRDRAQKGKN